MATKIIRLFILGVLFAGSVSANTEGNRDSSNNIRVAILQNALEFELSIRGSYVISNPVNRQIIEEGRRLEPVRIHLKNGSIYLDGISSRQNHLSIEVQKDLTVTAINASAKRYRQRIDIIVNDSQSFLVLNILDLEDYIKGVLYHEIDYRWPIEAIKAQAVAARTYALYQSKMNQKRKFDVSNDIYSQVYGGRDSERFRTNLSVDRTRGEILMYKGKILPTYFHATCGGHTENVEQLWNHTDLAPLRGRQCVFCRHSPHYSWKKNFRSKNIQDLLNNNGFNFGLIERFEVAERNDSGRIKTIRITERTGSAQTITGKKFRELIGPNTLKSNLYDFEMQGYYFDVIGSGWGHGVGLCQWGAFGMAQQRYDYREILQFYYPGSQIINHEMLSGRL